MGLLDGIKRATHRDTEGHTDNVEIASAMELGDFEHEKLMNEYDAGMSLDIIAGMATTAIVDTEDDKETARIRAISFASAVATLNHSLDAKIFDTDINAMSSMDIENASNFFKKLGNDTARVIESVINIARKMFAKTSAWMATNDDKLKELKKKAGEDSSKHQVKVADDDKEKEKLEKYRSKFTSFGALLNLLTVDKAPTADDLLKLAINIEDVVKSGTFDTSPSSGDTVISEVISAKSNMSLSSFAENLVNDSNATAMKVGYGGAYTYYLVYVENFTDPDDSSDDSQPYTATALIKNETKPEDEEAYIDGILQNIFSATALGKSTLVLLIASMGKGKDLQKLIDKSFKALDENKKKVTKTFETNPTAWEDKAKKAQGIKASYIGASNAIFRAVRSEIDRYRFQMAFVDCIANRLEKKPNDS